MAHHMRTSGKLMAHRLGGSVVLPHTIRVRHGGAMVLGRPIVSGGDEEGYGLVGGRSSRSRSSSRSRHSSRSGGKSSRSRSRSRSRTGGSGSFDEVEMPRKKSSRRIGKMLDKKSRSSRPPKEHGAYEDCVPSETHSCVHAHSRPRPKGKGLAGGRLVAEDGGAASSSRHRRPSSSRSSGSLL
jgi:hypothetical protein